MYLSVGLKNTAFDVGGIDISIGIGTGIGFFESFNYISHVINKNIPSNDIHFNKNTFREYIYIFIISLTILHANDYYNKTQIVKTEVFTSEPSF